MNHHSTIIQTFKRTAGMFTLLLFLFGYSVKFGHEYGLILPHETESSGHICQHPDHQHSSNEEDSNSDCLICTFDLIAVSPTYHDFSPEEWPLFGNAVPAFKIVSYSSQPFRELSGRGPPHMMA